MSTALIKFMCLFLFFADIDPAFSYRDVTIKRGSDPKQYYDVIEEIGR